jgi:hypothetical protein
MKNVILALLCSLLLEKGLGQTTTIMYDGSGHVIGGSFIKIPQGKPINLIDSASGNTYQLDSAHIMFTALDKSGKRLWKTDPWKDNNISVYRTKRPVIVDFKIVTTDRYHSIVSS